MPQRSIILRLLFTLLILFYIYDCGSLWSLPSWSLKFFSILLNLFILSWHFFRSRWLSTFISHFFLSRTSYFIRSSFLWSIGRDKQLLVEEGCRGLNVSILIVNCVLLLNLYFWVYPLAVLILSLIVWFPRWTTLPINVTKWLLGVLLLVSL